MIFLFHYNLVTQCLDREYSKTLHYNLVTQFLKIIEYHKVLHYNSVTQYFGLNCRICRKAFRHDV
jgi:hypothetical protein